VDWVFLSQALEVGPHGVGLKQRRLARIDVFQRECPRGLAGVATRVDRSVDHGVKPFIAVPAQL
jgi:hypothetical protein